MMNGLDPVGVPQSDGDLAQPSLVELLVILVGIIFGLISGFLAAKSICLAVLNAPCRPLDLGLLAFLVVAMTVMHQKKSARQRVSWAAAILGFGVLHVMLIIGILVGPDILFGSLYVDFDGKEWRSPSGVDFESSWPPRLRMVDDLIRNKYLDGLDREEVLLLLGSDLAQSSTLRQ